MNLNQTILEKRTTKVVISFCFFSLIGSTMPNLCPSVMAKSAENTTVQSPQQKGVIIKGKVVDQKGETIIGANIVEKGSSNGTISDIEGKYTLQIANKAILICSYIGYKNIEIPASLAKNGILNITLTENSEALNEVVVIGYGTQRKGDITSSIASVKAEDFIAGNISDAAELVKGKIAGLTITKSSGDPNGTSSILLRGIATLEGSTTPLILIDGIPGELSTVAPENIASIDVLKDASAAAIYGTRGANGVILITTKNSRRNEKVQAMYSGYVTASNFYKEADFMTSEDTRNGLTTFTDKGYDTDWVKAITHTGFVHNHNFNITGGNQTTTYSADASYREDNGVVKKTNSRDMKLSFDISHWMLNDILKVNFNLVKGLHKNNATKASEAGIANIYRQAVIHNPTAPIYNENGSYYEDFNVYQYYNPVSMINELKGENRKEWTRITSNITIEPIKGWQTNLMVATRRSFSHDESYQTTNYYACMVDGSTGSAYQGSSDSRSDHLELTSKYNLNKDKHHLTALAGYSYEYNVYSGFNASNYDYPTDFYLYNKLGLGSALKKGNAGMDSDKYDSKLIGFFGRISYGFDNKYNVLLSLRQEGSTKFGDNHKWGTFPSASVGWTISNEKFMKNISLINTLKLRAGYGVTGVEPNKSYLSMNRYGYGNSYYYNGNGWVTGLQATSNTNKDLKWEKSAEFNIGLDFSILKDRLSGSIDYYNKKTSDMLWWYNVPMPPNLYNETLANVGKMRNSGIEIVLNATPLKAKNFQWNTTITMSHNSNKLLSLSNDLYETKNYLNTGIAGDPVSLPTHRLEVGKSMGNYWGMKSVGISDNGLWMIENPETKEAKEFSADMLNDNYRQYLGNGLPKMNLGWSNTFRYKDFDLNIQMTGQLGFKILNEQRMFYENNSIAYNKLKSAANILYGKKALSSAQSQTFVSYYLEKGDYMKMTNLTLGYSIKLNESRYISKLRVYLSGENLFCITGYDGLDPELANTDLKAAGNDYRDKYPTIRSFTFGVNLTF